MRPGLLFFVLTLSACSIFQRSPIEKVREFTSWRYQLQGHEKNNKDSFSKKSELVVIDPDEQKRSPLDFHPQSVKLAYLSIGEAERYRSYFGRLDKGLILYENKNWPGNYKVKFWDPAWQKIILDRLESIVSEGYDGVYLDVVDAFYEIKPHKLRAAQMRDFLKSIAEKSKSMKRDFLIVQQNAPTLFEYLPKSQREAYFSLIDGIAFEDCFFYGEEKHDNKFNPQDYCVRSMKEFSKRGKFLLSVEYLKGSQKISQYFKHIDELNEVLSISKIKPLVAHRSLDGASR